MINELSERYAFVEHRTVIVEEFDFSKVNNKYSDEDFKRKESINKPNYETWDVNKEGDFFIYFYY